MTKIAILTLATSKNRDSWVSMKDTYLFNLTLKTFLLTMDKEHEYLFYIGVDKGDRIFDNKKEQELIIRFNIAFKNVEFIFYPIFNIFRGILPPLYQPLF